MARIALASRWASALTSQRGPLRLYPWLWLLLCTLGALVVAAPRILSQPIRYTSAAAVQVDAAGRYRELYSGGSLDDPDFLAVQNITLELLRAKYPTLGAPTFSVSFVPQADGNVGVIALGRSPDEARQLADEAAESLARNVQAAGGREIMRQLMGYELAVALLGNEPESPFQAQLRDIIRTTAFPLNKPTEPVARHITVDELQPVDLSALARALEVREDQLLLIDLPALERRRNGDQAVAAEQLALDQRRLTDGLQAIRGALGYLYNALNARFLPDMPSDAYRSARAQAGGEVQRNIAPLLALAAIVGLLFGGVGVAVDRSAGVMPKMRELWGYRELIRNLVLRDLRVRYKGSALGFLWTQIAPLLMMLVFLLVFTLLLPSGIALYSVFLIVGMLPWNFCAEAVAGGSRSVIDNANLIKKVFFPREVLPLVSVLSSLLNYLLSLPMMLLVMAVVQLLTLGRLNFSWTFAYLPVLVVIQTLFLVGVALFTSALAVFFRDFVHLIGILIQFWFFLTPVVYPLDTIDRSYGVVTLAQIIRWVNPMASLIDFYRDILYGNTVVEGLVPTPGLPALASVLRVLVTAVAVLAIGYWFFQRRSGQFGEEI
jgi:lipopolysaccharide transport system permease protein